MACAVTDESETVHRLQEEIKKLPSDDPSLCESQIPVLHKKILSIKNGEKREHLLSELEKISYKGLSPELCEMVKENGLLMESLPLVLNGQTQKNKLAKYLFEKSRETLEKEGMDAFREKLGPKLDVLGGMLSKGIDTSKEWAQNLVANAPSNQSLVRLSASELENLCEGVSNRDKLDVRRIATEAESQLTFEKNTSNRAIHKEKLEQAKSWMNEAKIMAKEESEASKKAVEEKMKRISELLKLPPDWNKQTVKTPDTLLEELGKKINLLNNAVAPSPPYISDEEIVQKASGGRALCGIHFSEYEAPSAAEVPLIVMPLKIMLSSPNNSHEILFREFAGSKIAAHYVQAVKSSSTNAGLGVGGYFDILLGGIDASYTSSKEEESEKLGKKQKSQASVVQSIWNATKTFKIDQEEYILSRGARNEANKLVKAVDEEKKDQSEELAKKFLDRYGSHMPTGLHTLGGILFRIVDAESEGEMTAWQLTEKSKQQFHAHFSSGLVEGAIDITGTHGSSQGTTIAIEVKEEKTRYSFSSQAIGPSATDPATFSKLLSNNSTWALIDRGEPKAYIPVWEMISKLGPEYIEAAKYLERVWTDKEKLLEEKLKIKDTPTNKAPWCRLL